MKKEVTDKSEIPITFSKDELLSSKKYRGYKDVLMVTLDDAKRYTIEEVEKEIEFFFNKEVK